MGAIKVLIVDDSAVVRKVLTDILSSDPELEVVGVAPDAKIALQKIRKVQPNVLTLDIEMPGMNGLTFLERLMKSNPMPVIVVSSLIAESTPEAFRALELGAVDIVGKPKLDVREKLAEISIEIIDKVKAAAQAKVKKPRPVLLNTDQAPPQREVLDKIAPVFRQVASGLDPLIAIGASTGGTDAIARILKQLPLQMPGIVIVQHMPSVFTKHFSERLNQNCRLYVKEAEAGDLLESGSALLAPGDQHMMLKLNAQKKYVIELDPHGLVQRHRPSVDVLFHSIANCAGENAIGVILTGMGRDGAEGIRAMKNAGAYTIAQDKKSSVVFGMPKVAIQLDAIETVLPLEDIAQNLVDSL